MNKAQFTELEKVFAKEIVGGMHQGNNAAIRSLEAGGYVEKYATKERTQLGATLTCEGWRTTLKGHHHYCTNC